MAQEKGKGKGTPRTDINPYAELVNMVAEQGVMQFKVHLSRQDPQTKQWRSLQFYPGMAPEDIARIEEIVQVEWGGGNYIAGISNNADPRERIVNYAFALEGPSIPKGSHGGPMQNPYTQQQQAGYQPQPQAPYGQQPGYGGQMTGPQINPSVAGPWGNPYGGYPGYGYGPPPWWASPPHQQKDSGPSPEQLKLEEQNNMLAQQLEQYREQLNEEKHRREADERDRRFERQLEQQAQQHKEEMAALREALNKNTSSDETRMLEYMTKMNDGTNAIIREMQRAQIDNDKAALERSERALEKDFEYRKQMFDMIQGAQDPMKHAELIDKFGQFAFNNINGMVALAEAGIMGGGKPEEEAAWVKPARELVDGLKEFGKAAFAKQRTQQQYQRMHSTHPYRFPPQGPQFQNPGTPQQQRQLQAQQQAQRQQAQKQQQQEEEEQPKVQTVKPGKIPIPQIDIEELLLTIGSALMQREEPVIVGEMVYNVSDICRYWRKLPPEWELIYTDPKAFIVALLEQYQMAPKDDDEEAHAYLDAVADVVKGIEADFQAEQAERQGGEHEQVPQMHVVSQQDGDGSDVEEDEEENEEEEPSDEQQQQQEEEGGEE